MSDKFPGGFLTTGAPAGFSVVFGATTSKLSIASMTALGSDFTIECWIYPTSFADYNTIWDSRASDTDANGGAFGLTAANKAYFYTNSTFQLTTTALTANRWTHLALVRSGSGSGNVKIYINGVADATTATYTTSFSRTAASIGDDWNTRSNLQFFGYISNFRTLTTALYTTTFTPPTQLFPVTSTTLLTCQSPTIIDNSSSAVAITLAGSTTPVVSNFTPFAGYKGFNPALGAAAGGVWTIDESAYYQGTRKWPIYDPYFNQTTLMLHGNGTNAAQNNTFLDSSTNNFTITRNGNTTQGTFTPFSQTGWSYNGTAGAYCQLNNADYAIGTGDFTIEFWMYCVDDTSYGSSAFAGLPGGGTLTISMTGGSSNARLPYLEFGGAGTTFGALSGYLNRWTHVAFVRTSGNVVVYQNGVATGSPVSKSASFPNSANLYLARLPTDTAQDFRGYLSNYRITKAAVYSSNFTPSTTPFVPVSNTVLLTFQDNRFVDNSALRATVTPAGTASVQAFSPFVPTVITPTTYSNYFDGTADYLSSPTNAAFGYGTSDFTVEFWLYLNSNVLQTIYSNLSSVSSINPHIYVSTTIRYYTNGADRITGATLSAGQWYFIAVCKASGSTKLFVNGVQSGSTYTDANNYGSTAPLGIGTYWDAGAPVATSNANGVISNLRVLKGTALYTAAFTPPTAPLTAITNTTLLTCQSSTFVDNSVSALTLTANGNVQPVTSPTPFPAKVDQTTLNTAYSTSLIGGSGYFDGTSDYLSLSSTSLNLGANDFTIEMWVYATTTARDFIIGSISNAAGLGAWTIMLNDSQPIRFFCRYNSLTVLDYQVGSGTFPINQWVHLAVTRSGANLRVFQNGTQLGTTNTTLSTFAIDNALTNYYVASSSDPGEFYTGYLSGTRLLVGTALYTTTFTPPTAPPTAITNTTLLLNYTNAGIIDNTAKNVLETVGNAAISTVQSKWGGASMAFDGTTDWLQIPYSATGDLGGTTQFTIEFWVYMNSLAARGTVAARNNGSTAAGSQFDLNIETTGQVNVAFYTGASTISINSATGVITTGRWIHVVLSKDNVGNYKIFVDGTQSGSTTTNTGSINSPTIPMTIGAQNTSGGVSLNGYIDDLRITRGVARYTTNFTPPTSQLQDQ